MQISVKNKQIIFDKPVLMGVLNITPDSFSDGGKFTNIANALEHAKEMITQGAQIIDVGGESSRPGADPVPLDEELNRVIPIIEELSKLDCVISIDTYKPEVARQAIAAGAHIINDITGLKNSQMATLAAQHNVPVIIMHMQGAPQTMQKNPQYEDVITDIKTFFKQQIAHAKEAGVTQIILDPGIGFGKTLEHNLMILKELHQFKELGYPLLIGASRKSFINMIEPTPIKDRLSGTLAAHAIALQNGANILRIHDVHEHKKFLEVLTQLM